MTFDLTTGSADNSRSRDKNNERASDLLENSRNWGAYNEWSATLTSLRNIAVGLLSPCSIFNLRPRFLIAVRCQKLTVEDCVRPNVHMLRYMLFLNIARCYMVSVEFRERSKTEHVSAHDCDRRVYVYSLGLLCIHICDCCYSLFPVVLCCVSLTSALPDVDAAVYRDRFV